MDIEINSNGNNAAIKYNILSNKKMKRVGFQRCNNTWWLKENLGCDVTLNVIIPNDGGDIHIYAYDEQYMQGYDYQYVLKVYPNEFSFAIKDKIDDIMEMLIDKGIIYGWKRGDFI
jgi:hypothetical protein